MNGMTKKVILRKCIFSNQVLPISNLVRFAKNKTGDIFFDPNFILKGRGSYCQKNYKIVLEVINRKMLNRAFKQNITLQTYQKLTEEVHRWKKILENQI